MIRVAFFRKEGRIIGFESEGHAGYADSGYDIVCAAVSALLITCVNGLESVVSIEPTVRQNDEVGYLKAELPDRLDEAQLHDAGIVLDVTEQGLQAIAQQYPGFLRVSTKNRR